MKARAAVEFVGGLVVKNKFSVSLEAVNGKLSVPHFVSYGLLRNECWKMTNCYDILMSSGEIDGEVWKRLSSGGGYHIKPNLLFCHMMY